MKTTHLLYLLAMALLGSAPVSAEILFQDNFDSGTLSSAWTSRTTQQGRIRVTTEFGPASGTHHLVLDDSVFDANFSEAQVSFALDLSNRKNVELTFKIKSLNPFPEQLGFGPPGAINGISSSVDGGKNWETTYWFANLTSEWETIRVPLRLIGQDPRYNSLFTDFRLRFSTYNNAPAPIDGIAIDDVSLVGDLWNRAMLQVPAQVMEGKTLYPAYLTQSLPSPTPTVFSLTSEPSNLLEMPETVVIPAGQTFTTFYFSPKDDDLAYVASYVRITAHNDTEATTSDIIQISDNDLPTLTLTLPSELTEGSEKRTFGLIQLSHPLVNPSGVYLAEGSLPGALQAQIAMPSYVFLQPGQTQIPFEISANNDQYIEDDIVVPVSAFFLGSTPAEAQVTIHDNDVASSSMIFNGPLIEGSTAPCTIQLSFITTNSLPVHIEALEPTTLEFPSTILLPSGQNSVQFNLTAPDNHVANTSRTVTLRATVSNLPPISATIVIQDNSVTRYEFVGLPDAIYTDRPQLLAIRAFNTDGTMIPRLSQAIELNLLLPDGKTIPLETSGLQPGGNEILAGSVNLPPLTVSPVQFQIKDASGVTGESKFLATLSILPLNPQSVVWDKTRKQLYVSISGGSPGAYAHHVIAIDPEGGKVIRSVPVYQEPTQLALTDNDQFLYVARSANGTVSQIKLDDFSILNTFALGSSANQGTFYAGDISTVAGSPDLLVVSRFTANSYPRAAGVAAYHNGIRLPVEVSKSLGNNQIEPSSQPNIFYGFDTESVEGRWSKLQLTTNGIVQIANGTRANRPFPEGVVSSGDLIFTPNGLVLDGSTMTQKGSSEVAAGLPRPDFAAERVFFWISSGSSILSAYDNTLKQLIQRIELPFYSYAAKALVTWGEDGFAIPTNDSLILVRAGQFITRKTNSDLGVTIARSPDPIVAGESVTYSVTLTNHGPDTAELPSLDATLPNEQEILQASASSGSVQVASHAVRLQLNNLAPGEAVTLSILSKRNNAGILACEVSTRSLSYDPDLANNQATHRTSIGYRLSPTGFGEIDMNAQSMVYDPLRKRLWVATFNPGADPKDGTVVGIDPETGLISMTIPLNAQPFAKSIALSSNGRFLYVGLANVFGVQRIDLSTSPPQQRVITTGSTDGSAYTQGIVCLEGDGTSFVASLVGENLAVVYDNATRRSLRTPPNSVQSLGPTANPAILIGFSPYNSGNELSQLEIIPAGIRIVQSRGGVLNSSTTSIHSDSNYLFSSDGILVDTSDLTLKANFRNYGAPGLDAPRGLAFQAQPYELRSYSIKSGTLLGTFRFPTTSSPANPIQCLNCGTDKLAILTDRGPIRFIQWLNPFLDPLDDDHDGVSDAWENSHFGSLNTPLSDDFDGDGFSNALEYLFGTSPLLTSSHPVFHPTASSQEGVTTLKITFPRRYGITSSEYRYEMSSDLKTWTPANAAEVITNPGESIEDQMIQTVEASITLTQTQMGFVRMIWK